MHRGASCHQDLGQVATGGRGSVPGSPSPSIFAYKIRARERVRKPGEGEPGDEASFLAVKGAVSNDAEGY